MDLRCLIRDDENKQGPLRTSGHTSPGPSLREGREGSVCVVGARYGTARRINGSAARARMPTMRWQATLECPQMRT